MKYLDPLTAEQRERESAIKPPDPPHRRRVEMPDCCMTCERYRAGVCQRYGPQAKDSLCDDFTRKDRGRG